MPLYLAADGPRSLKLAGRLADGVITMGGSPTLLKWKLGLVAQGAEEAGRDPAESVKASAVSPGHFGRE